MADRIAGRTRWSIALIVLALCAPATMNASDDATEKEGQITDIRILRVGQSFDVVRMSHDDLQVWEAPADSLSGKWRMIRTWHNFVYFWYGLGNGKDVIIVTKDGSALYEVGNWNVPVLTLKDGASGTIKSIMNIYPSDPKSLYVGIAVQIAGGSESGSQNTWALYSAKDGETWQKLAIEHSPSIINDMIRIAPGVLALAGPEHDQPSTSTAFWHLFQLNDSNEWVALDLTRSQTRISDVKSFAYPRGLSIKLEGEGASAARHWFFGDGSKTFQEIHSVIPSIPAHIADMTSYGGDNILYVLGSDQGAANDTALLGSYFRQDQTGKWMPLSTELGPTAKNIFALKTFQRDRGIAFQPQDLNSGSHDAMWSVEYLADAGKWEAVQEVFPTAPKEIWNVQSFADGNGVGLESGSDPKDASNAFEWTWFLQVANQWRLLSTVIPSAPIHVWDVQTTNISNGISLRAESSTGEIPTWKWFLRTKSEAWKEIADVLNLPAGFPDRDVQGSVSLPESDDKNLRRGVIGVWNSKGEARWFIRANNQWISVDDAIQKSAP